LKPTASAHRRAVTEPAKHGKRESSTNFWNIGMKSSMKLSAFTISIFATALLALSGASAHAETKGALQKNILQQVSAGHDARELIKQYRAAYPATGSPFVDYSAEIRQYNQAEQALIEALGAQQKKAQRAGSDNANQAASAYIQWKAALLIVNAHHQKIAKALSDKGAAGVYQSRHQEMMRGFGQRNQTLQQLLDPVLDPSAATMSKSGPGSTAAANPLAAATKLLQQQAPHTRTPILKAANLPVGSLNLATRAPVGTPAITPSYAAGAEVAATAADTADSLDAPLSNEMLQQASTLGNDYVKIYEFVRNSVKTEWYAGSVRGATGTLRSNAGNDVDQASLLIALLRSSSVPSRYVQGVIELSVAQVASDLGLADSSQVPAALTKAGIAFTPIARGGSIAAVAIEHTWVSALVPYTNYRGAMVDSSGKTWIPLDPSYKNVVTSAATANEAAAGGAASLQSAYLGQLETQSFGDYVAAQITTALQKAASGTVNYQAALGAQSVTPLQLSLLPNSLPYVVDAVTREDPALSSADLVQVEISMQSGGTVVLDSTLALNEIGNQRLTLSYTTASPEDDKLMLSFGGLDAVPLYLIQLRPQLKVGGQVRIIGQNPVSPGSDLMLTFTITGPFGKQQYTQTVTAGAYHALEIGGATATRPSATDPSDEESTAAHLLDGVGVTYNQNWVAGEQQFAALTGVAVLRPAPSVSIVSNQMTTAYLNGVPQTLTWQGVTMDALSHPVDAVPAVSGGSPKDFMTLSALHGSSLESQVFASQFEVESISADRGLELAHTQNIQILTLTSANIAALSSTNHPAAVQTAITNLVSQGYSVDVPATQITDLDWTGSVWRATDPVSGAAGYFISGNLAGGSTSPAPDVWTLDFLADALRSANSQPFDEDPMAGTQMQKLGAGDGQTGTVNMALPIPLGVMVLDANSKPVLGASVTFSVTAGGGTLAAAGGSGGGSGATSVVATTDQLGIANAILTLGKSTADNAVYTMLKTGDTYATQVGWTVVDVSAQSTAGTLPVSAPFTAVATPDVQSQLKQVSPNAVQSTSVAFTSGYYQGSAGTWFDNFGVEAEDQYGNPIANVKISFAMSSQLVCSSDKTSGFKPGVVFDNTFGSNGKMVGCSIASPLLGDCGSANASETTPTVGTASVGVILSNDPIGTNTVTATGGGFTASESYTANGLCGNPDQAATYSALIQGGGEISNAQGVNVSAAKLTSQYAQKVNASLYASTYDYEVRTNASGSYIHFFPYASYSKTSGSVSFSVTNGGSTNNQAGDGQGGYTAGVVTGSTTGADVVSATATNVDVKVPKIVSGSLTIQDQSIDIPSTKVATIYAVQPTITQMQDAFSGNALSQVPVDGNGNSQTQLSLAYKIDPSQYTDLATDIDLFQNGAWISYFTGSSKSGTGTAVIPRAVQFDPNQHYQSQLVLNRGSQIEMRSDMFEMPTHQKLLISASKSVRTSTEVDIPNKRVCDIEGDLQFVVSQPVNATLTAVQVDVTGAPLPGGPITLIDNVAYPAGTNNFSIDAMSGEGYTLGTGNFQFTLKVVSQTDSSQTDQAQGVISAIAQDNYQLPVGQILVKGVNVKNGSLVAQSESIDVPGRGPALRFQPTYSSGGRGSYDAMGVNWTHNFESSIHINSCGDVIVSGGDAGGAHFFPQSDGILKPDRGYHSTLIRNTSDYSFDFYSKDGTRYHYVFFPRTKKWQLTYVQDTNGNTQTLNYDMNAVPAPLLVNVTDSAGRQLNFKYTLQSLLLPIAAQAGQPLAAELPFLQQVTGPGGLEMDFNYDTYGNLLSVSRNGRTESFTYSEDALWWFDKGMLKSYTDPNGNVTGYTFNQQSFTVNPTTGASAITVPYSFVTQVKTPTGTVGFAIDPTTWQKTTVTNENGAATTYNMNIYGNPLSIADPAGTTTMEWMTDDVLMLSKTDARGVQTTFGYDSAGNQTSAAVAGATTSHTYLIQTSAPYINNRVTSLTDRNGNHTVYSYDGNGNLTTEQKPEGVTIMHAYAGNGDRLSTTDGNGGVTQYTYDAAGELIATAEPSGATSKMARDARERVTSSSDPDGNTTGFVYDDQDRVTQRVDAIGGKKNTTYDANGNKLTEQDENGNTTIWTYDPLNHPATETDAAGDGKTFTYDPLGNKVSETDFRGHATTYTYDGVNRVTNRLEPLGKATAYQYDAVGNVTQETDALSRVTKHTYDDMSRRIGTVDAAGSSWVLGYDANGNKTLSSDANGNSTSYSYDGLNRLTSAAQPLGRTTGYTYDHNSNKLTETDPNGNVTKYRYDSDDRMVAETDALGFITTHTYDPAKNLLQSVDARLSVTKYSYDALNRKKDMTDGEGDVTQYQYDAVGNLTQETEPNNNTIAHTYDQLNRRTSTTDSIGNVGAWTYDADGNKLTETDGNGNTVSHTYNELNHLTASSLPAGRSITYTLDLMGNITGKVDLGTTTSYTFDLLDRMTADDESTSGGGIITTTYDPVGNKLSVTDRSGNVTKYTYDKLNRQTVATDPLGQTVSTTYDPLGNKLTQIDKRGTKSSFTYDKENRPLTITKDGVLIDTRGYDEVGNQIFSTDANGNTTSYTYDKRDLRIAENRLLGAITKFTLDKMGDAVKVTDPEGRVTTNSYDYRRHQIATTNGAGETTQRSFDLSNNHTQTIRPLGNSSTYKYDAANRLIQVTDGVGGVTTYDYDSGDNHTGFTDANGNKTIYSYDKLHRRTGIIYPGGATEAFTYDLDSNLQTHVDGNGMTTTRTFDALNRETRKSYSTSADNMTSVATGYDANNNVISVTQTGGAAAGTSNFSYDNFDRVQRHVDTFGAVVNTTYDANGNKTGLVTGDNKVTRYSYDTLNRVSSIIGQSGTINYSYDKSSLNTQIAYSNAVSSSMTYDGAQRVVEITHSKNGSNLSRTDYVYDKNGNRLKETINRLAGAQATAYAFDADDRLTTSTLTNANETVVTSYTLDPVSNRIAEQITTTPLSGSPSVVNKTYTYNGRNELVGITDTSAGNTTLGYDNQGNLVRKDVGSETTLYIYNAADNLIQIAKNGNVLGSYGNDFRGLRVVKIAPDPLRPGSGPITLNTIWDGRNAFQDSVGGIVTARYESDGHHPVSMWSQEDGVQALHHDALGSIVATTDISGNLKSENIYDEYGNIEIQSGLSANKFGYTGHQMDQESGLIYFQARYYDPTLGMFISQDPYGGSWDTPMSLHHYLYAYGNPTVYVDRDGQSATVVGAIGGFFWGFGQMAGGMTSDLINGRSRSTGQYLGVWGQNIVAGVEIGASIDVGLMSGGLAAPASGALGNAGFGALTFNGQGKTAGEFAKDQAKDAALGAVGGQLVKVAAPVISKVGGAIIEKGMTYAEKLPATVKAAAGDAAKVVSNKAKELSNKITDNYVKSEFGQTVAKADAALKKGLQAAEDGIAKLRGGGSKTPMSDTPRSAIGTAESAGDAGVSGTSKTVQNSQTVKPKPSEEVANHSEVTSNENVANKQISGKKKFWNDPIQVNGRRVYQRDDLFDPNQLSKWTERGKVVEGTNVERMASGRAPKGYDGKSVNLHHLTQDEPGALAELGGEFHSDNTAALHGFPPGGKSFRNDATLDRQFNNYTKEYWKTRAEGFENEK
jgi:RHS repeat-associated protein